MIPITVNGQPREIPAGMSVAALVAELGFAGKRVAVERNGEIVPRSQHAQATLAAADAIEIVVAVGGG